MGGMLALFPSNSVPRERLGRAVDGTPFARSIIVANKSMLYTQAVAFIGVGGSTSEARVNPLASLGYQDHQFANAPHVVMITA